MECPGTVSRAGVASRRAASQGIAGLLLLGSVTSLAAVAYEPQRRLLLNDHDGSGRLVEALQGGLDLTAALPSFIQPDLVSQLPPVIGWLTAAVFPCAVAVVLGHRRTSSHRAFWSGAIGLFVFATTGSLVSGQGETATRESAVVHYGQQGLLAAFDGNRSVAYSYRERTVLSQADLFARATIVQRIGERPSFDDRLPPIPMPCRPGDMSSGSGLMSRLALLANRTIKCGWPTTEVPA